METSEIIIRDNGVLLQRTVSERELDAGPVVMEALTQGVTRVARHVLEIPGWGTAHANVGFASVLWSVRINRLELNARFRLIGQVMCLALDASADLDMCLVWRAPETVRLIFVVGTTAEEDCCVVNGNWLLACDQAGRAYRLPLSNLHDDGRLCTGDFAVNYRSAGEAIAASLEQLRKSRWNSDLMRTSEETFKFFRFRPTNETFETLPIEARDWTALCEKVSTAITERIVL